MGSIDLMDVTNVMASQFATPAVTITDLKDVPGVFTFNLTWDDITKNLKRKSIRFFFFVCDELVPIFFYYYYYC
jgi:hypothetical protein